MSFAGAEVIIDPVSIEITVVSYQFLSKAVKLIKMFSLKPLKINLNTVLETIIFGICNYVFIEFVYCILVEGVNVSRLNVCAVVKEDFEVSSLGVV